MAHANSQLGMALGLILLIGGCSMSGQDANVVVVPESDARMNSAMEEARSTVGACVDTLGPRPPRCPVSR